MKSEYQTSKEGLAIMTKSGGNCEFGIASDSIITYSHRPLSVALNFIPLLEFTQMLVVFDHEYQ